MMNVRMMECVDVKEVEHHDVDAAVEASPECSVSFSETNEE